MSLDALVEIIHSSNLDRWTERNEAALDGLFGGGARFAAKAKKSIALRAPLMKSDSGVSYAAYTHPENPTSGAYGGLSFVMFPVPEQPCLIGLVVGTGGLDPDHNILGRPGHARKAQAICAWLNSEYGDGKRVAWAKQDPTRTDISAPRDLTGEMSEYKDVFDRYGHVIYALYRPNEDRTATKKALAAFLDMMLEERGHLPLSAESADAADIRRAWFEYLMPSFDRSEVVDLLNTRRFVIVQGPPGTGKTRMAVDLLNGEYGGRGNSVQFHPNTSYENFVGGLAPAMTGTDLGLRFAPTPGFLMQAATQALKSPDRPYLLHIDEINRADLSKVLGEAIFLLEPAADRERRIELPYDFGDPFKKTFFLPKNLHILGTMNSADRSIAIVDVAVRRRFAFVSLWPQAEVVSSHGCKLMREAFDKLISHFIEHAGDDAFPLVPGHSYFLEKDPARAARSLKVNLAPLLEEYLAQGYVSGFAEPIRSYLQWLRAQ